MFPFVLLLLLQAPVRPAVERFAIDAKESSVGFRGTSDLHDFEGRTSDVAGELLLDRSDPRACAVGSVRVLARSLDTDSGRRDAKMRELLEAEAHEHLGFELASSSDPLGAAGGDVRLAGTFTVRGVRVRKEVVASVERLAGGGLRVRGEAALAMSAFGIEPPSVLFIDTDDGVVAFWDLVLQPVVGERVPAETRALTVVSELRSPGGTPQRGERREVLFTCAGGALWDRGETWHVVGREGRASLDLARLRALRPTTAEERARDLSAERERIVSRGGALAGDDVLARIDGLLALVPTAPAEVVRDAEGLAVRMGGEVWLQTSGRKGDGDFGACLAGLDGLPEAVRAALAELEGVPEHVLVRTVTSAGLLTLDIRAAETEPGELYDWALAPSRWIPAGTS